MVVMDMMMMMVMACRYIYTMTIYIYPTTRSPYLVLEGKIYDQPTRIRNSNYYYWGPPKYFGRTHVLAKKSFLSSLAAKSSFCPFLKMAQNWLKISHQKIPGPNLHWAQFYAKKNQCPIFLEPGRIAQQNELKMLSAHCSPI